MAKKATPAPAPKDDMKRKRAVAAARRRKRKTALASAVRKRGWEANPPLAKDFTHVLLPGFAGYAATRVLQRIVFMMVQRKWPKLGKHASALAGAAGFGATWFFAHKVERLAKYHDGIVMGSGVAALHGIATCYLPDKYKWLLTDCRTEDVQPKQLAAPQTIATAPAASASAGDEFDFLERPVEGRRTAYTIAPPKKSARPIASALNVASHGSDSAFDPDLTSELGDGEAVDDLYSGSFSDNN